MSWGWRSAVLVVVLVAGSAGCRRGGARASGGNSAEQTLSPTVAVATEQEFIREISVSINPKTRTWGRFEVRRGARVPFEGFWQRYAPFVGIPPSALVLVRPPRPDSVLPNGKVYDFQQVHRGYPVANYGYSVQVVDGYVASGLGKAMTGLPDALPTPISSDRALAVALEQVEPKGARPWVTDPARWRPPESALTLWTGKTDPTGSDFHLGYHFSFSSTGVTEPGSLTIDAATAQVVARNPGSIR